LRSSCLLVIERIWCSIEKYRVEIGDNGASLAHAVLMKDDSNIFKARAADIDETDPKLIKAHPEHLLHKRGHKNLLSIALDEQDALCKKNIAAYRIKIALKAAHLVRRQTGSRLIGFATPFNAAQHIHILDIA